MDWEKNVDPDYRKHFFRPPLVITEDERHAEKWVVYATGTIAAKELTIAPGARYLAKDRAAYGCILTQGHGRLGTLRRGNANPAALRRPLRGRILRCRTRPPAAASKSST